MSDNLSQVWNQFFNGRSRPLTGRFSGMWRAVVVETNDPLQMRRVRFKIPELHDFDLKPEECPWAVAAPALGTKRCGQFSYPCIGDYVWIAFEKNHPYGPVWTGFSDPTRRKFYPLPSIYGRTPLPVDEDSEKADNPNDFDEDYLPKDGRPMSYGVQDRYGNLDIFNATGFFPIDHRDEPPSPDTDPLTQGEFQQATEQPSVNDPDSKMMMRATKYGMIMLQGDMGYVWQKSDSGEEGEFFGTGPGDVEGTFAIGASEGDGDERTLVDKGEKDKDEEFEIERWKYIQRLIHEDSPKDRDQRRIQLMTRYGHKFEMRDVGWFKSREEEYSQDKRIIGDQDADDQRWIKWRTKGGHLIQMIDAGFDPEEDEFVKRKLIDEVSKDEQLDKEDKLLEKIPDDARMLRFVTRSGIKLALDDRTSHDKEAENPDNTNEDIGIGILLKGRATPGTKADNYGDKSGEPKGYFWQFDERPDRNSTSWGSPRGQVIEIDDNNETLFIGSRLPSIVTDWKNLEDNEFLETAVFDSNPVTTTHHLWIDHASEIVRLKSRAGKGEGPEAKRLGDPKEGEHAGLEIHDAPSDKPWTELVDIEHRGMWFSTEKSLGIWRAKQDSELYVWIDDQNNKIVVHNGTGVVQIYASTDVEIIAERNMTFKAGGNIQMEASSVKMRAGGGQHQFDSNYSNSGRVISAFGFDTQGDVRASSVYAAFPTVRVPIHVASVGDGAASPAGSPPTVRASNVQMEPVPDKIEPDDRAETII